MTVADLFCFSLQCSCYKKKPDAKRNPSPNESDLEPHHNKRYAAPYDRNGDGIETFEDFVKQHGRKCEIKRRKKAKKGSNNGTLRRIFAVLTSCKTQPKAQEPTFWIEAAPGYPERRMTDI